LGGFFGPEGFFMYYLARGLQLFGMANLMVAFFIGVTEEQGMGIEMLLLGVGSLLFLLGRYLQGKGK
jgi:hypothetical protein